MANKYFRKYLIPAAATSTAMYTVPEANSAVVRSLRVTNAGAGVATITVTHTGTGTPYYLQKDRSLTVNTTFDVFNGIPCVLETGDVLNVTSSIAGVHFYLSYLEIDRQ
jgi:ABC-type sulfate transport system permease component